MPNTRSSLRTAGILFIAAFILYGGGNALFESVITSPEGAVAIRETPAVPAIAGTLMLLNSVAVAAIGVLFFPILRSFDPTAAAAYLSGRIAESVLMTVGVIFLLLHIPLASLHSEPAPFAAVSALLIKGNYYAYQAAMVMLSIAGVIFCQTLNRHRLLPRWLGLWGVAGYVVFLVGSLAEILGYPWGLIAAVPGGLFEIVFGVRLAWKGLDGTITQEKAI